MNRNKADERVPGSVSIPGIGIGKRGKGRRIWSDCHRSPSWGGFKSSLTKSGIRDRGIARKKRRWRERKSKDSTRADHFRHPRFSTTRNMRAEGARNKKIKERKKGTHCLKRRGWRQTSLMVLLCVQLLVFLLKKKKNKQTRGVFIAKWFLLAA